jgi:hypothetical protein
VKKDIVTGNDLFRNMGGWGGCEKQRSSRLSDDCGPEGRYFELKVEWKLEDLFKRKEV